LIKSGDSDAVTIIKDYGDKGDYKKEWVQGGDDLIGE